MDNATNISNVSNNSEQFTTSCFLITHQSIFWGNDGGLLALDGGGHNPEERGCMRVDFQELFTNKWNDVIYQLCRKQPLNLIVRSKEHIDVRRDLVENLRMWQKNQPLLRKHCLAVQKLPYSGKKCSKMENIRVDASNVTVIPLSADNSFEFMEEYNNVLPVLQNGNSKNKMLVLHLLSRNPNSIMWTCINMIKRMETNCGKMVILEKKSLEDNAREGVHKEEFLVNNDVSPYIDSHDCRDILIAYGDSREKIQKFIERIKKGDTTLTKLIRECYLNVVLDTTCKEIEIVRLPELDFEKFIALEAAKNGLQLGYSKKKGKTITKPLIILIINDRFAVDNLVYRDGAYHDQGKIDKFARRFGVTPIVHYNVDDALEVLHDDLINASYIYDSVLLFLSSHGYDGGFYMADSKLHVNDLFDGLSERINPSIPLICFGAVCQGADRDSPSFDEWQCNNIEHCYKDNLYVFLAAFPGIWSYRHPGYGTMFFESLCKAFPGSPYYDKHLVEEYPNGISLSELANEVKFMFSNYTEITDGKIYNMSPCVIINTLREEVIFPLSIYRNIENGRTSAVSIN